MPSASQIEESSGNYWPGFLCRQTWQAHGLFAGCSERGVVMTVIALAIEPGALADRFTVGLAASMAIELADRRRSECTLAERSDACGGSLPHFASKWIPFARQCGMTQQLRQRTAVETLEIAQRGNVIIVGWAAPIVLSLARGVLRVFIHAPMTIRERNIMQQLAYDDVRMARWEIESRDGLLCRFVRRMFDADWRDPSLYDLVLDAEDLSPAVCAEMVRRLAECPQYQDTIKLRGDLAAMSRAVRRQDTKANTDAVVIGLEQISLAGIGSREEAIARVERFLRGANGENGVVLSRPTWKDQQ
jgi:cytidylate kinase